MRENLPAAVFAAAFFAVFGIGTRGQSAVAAPPAVSTADKTPRRTVQFALRIEQSAPVDAAAPAEVTPPKVLGTPSLSTLDRDTASVVVANTNFSYSIALSPIIEGGGRAQETVQTAWNVRLTGKSLPSGNTSVSLAGATRLPSGKESVLAEITLRDGTSGKPTLYRVWATPTLPASDAVTDAVTKAAPPTIKK